MVVTKTTKTPLIIIIIIIISSIYFNVQDNNVELIISSMDT